MILTLQSPLSHQCRPRPRPRWRCSLEWKKIGALAGELHSCKYSHFQHYGSLSIGPFMNTIPDNQRRAYPQWVALHGKKLFSLEIQFVRHEPKVLQVLSRRIYSPTTVRINVRMSHYSSLRELKPINISCMSK